MRNSQTMKVLHGVDYLQEDVACWLLLDSFLADNQAKQFALLSLLHQTNIVCGLHDLIKLSEVSLEKV